MKQFFDGGNIVAEAHAFAIKIVLGVKHQQLSLRKALGEELEGFLIGVAVVVNVIIAVAVEGRQNVASGYGVGMFAERYGRKNLFGNSFVVFSDNVAPCKHSGQNEDHKQNCNKLFLHKLFS